MSDNHCEGCVNYIFGGNCNLEIDKKGNLLSLSIFRSRSFEQQTDSHTYIQTDGQTDRQTGKQTEGQTD